jgi:hypothetical protein
MCLDMDQGMDPVVVDLGLGSDLAMELDRALESDPDVAFSLKSSSLVPDVVCAGTMGTVGRVDPEDASTISPVVDPASQAVMAAAASGGIAEGPGEDPAYAMGSGCPSGSVDEEVGITESSPAEGHVSATLAVTIDSSVPEIVFPAACREAGTSKSGASVVDGLNVVSRDESKLAVMGLSWAEVHPEITQQGCASGSLNASAEALVYPTEVVLRLAQTQTSLSTPVTADKVEAEVTTVEIHVSRVECPAVVSVIPVGVSAVTAKEGESVKIATAKGLLRRGFLGAKNDSSSSLSEMKEVSSPEKGPKVLNEASQVCSSSKKHEGYARRAKEKFAKQVYKNRELFTEVVVDSPEKGEENYSEVALDALKFASKMGWTGGEGDEKSLLNLFSKIEEERKPTFKIKGKRELKNLECSINYEDKERPSPERCNRHAGLCWDKKYVFRSTRGALGALCLSGDGGGLWVVVLVHHLVVFIKPFGCDY